MSDLVIVSKSEMPNPSEADLTDPLFNAIWEVTKTWDVNAPEYYDGYCGLNGSHVMIILNAIRALLDKATPCGDKPVEADFFQLDNGGDYWHECPDDDAIISDLDDAIVGTEYSVFASHTYRQTYRITKIPDETSDDTEVELVSSQRSYYTSPKPAIPEGYALVSIEPTEAMVLNAINTFGGVMGSPENLANPEYVNRMLDRQKKAVIGHYTAMIAEAMKG